LRIGYLYDFQAHPPRGGNHVHAYELTQGFLAEGHSVATVDDPTMPGVDNYCSSPDELARFASNIDILYVRIDGRLLSKWPTLQLCMSLIKSKPVIWEINAPANESLAYSWLSGRSVTDGGEGLWRKFRRWQHALRKKPGIKFEENFRRSMAKRVNAAICVSSSLSQYARKDLGIENVIILPNGGPLISRKEIEQRGVKHSDNSFSVFYCGSAMYPWQGLDYLTEVIKLAEVEEPGIKFSLAVNQKHSSIPETSNVTILEHLDRDQIFDAICSSDACVSIHPEYPWSKYGFHNSPMKLFEYMACARPSVTSNHGQMAEIINDGIDGLLCENNPRDILDKLKRLKNDRPLAQQIGNNARKRIQAEFSWQKDNVKKTLTVFQQLASNVENAR
jgi:glycosyltransferase involved in cell wall biosynthesis